MSALDFDVCIIGAGVIGSAAARELSRYRLRIAVLDKAPDVCFGTSGRNSGVLHAGFNNKSGSKMARFCVEGNRTFDTIAAELDVPFSRTGKLVVGYDEDDRAALEKLIANGKQNGTPGLRLVDADFIHEKCPAVDAPFAMWSPSTAILNPFQYTLGLAENACTNGVQFFFRHEVMGLHHDGAHWTIDTARESFRARWVINAAGLYADRISTMLGIDEYVIHPCRGEYYVLDRSLSPLLPLPVYPVPNYKTGGLGIHLTPTTGGSIIVGPSTEYIEQRDDYRSTKEIMALLIEDGSRIFPYLKPQYFLRNYCGIRPKLTAKGVGGYHDFVIERRDAIAPYAINLVGIESPGLTSAMPIAHEIIRLMSEVERFEENPDFNPIRRRPESFRDKTPDRQRELVAQDPDYGRVICRCETITLAEIKAALNSPLHPDTVAGIKNRCRPTMGRCQGGYCLPHLVKMIAEATGRAENEILLTEDGSEILTEGR